MAETFKSIQNRVMRESRKLSRSEEEAERALRKALKDAGIPVQEGMAEEINSKEYYIGDDKKSAAKEAAFDKAKAKYEARMKKAEALSRKTGIEAAKNANSKSRGGMPKKVQMMRGGMANGKEHMYAAGGSVNDGLKSLAKTRPDVVAKILK